MVIAFVVQEPVPALNDAVPQLVPDGAITSTLWEQVAESAAAGSTA